MKFLILIFAFTSFAAQARWQTVKEAGAVLEQFNFQYEVHKDGTSDQLSDYVIRVQSEDGKNDIDVFNIDYNGLTEKVEIIEAFTLNGKQKIPVEASAIEDRDKGESKEYDAMKVRSVVFPQVQVGSKIHIKFKIKTTKPLIKDRWSVLVKLTPGYAIEHMNVKVQSELPLTVATEDPRGWVVVKQKDKTHVEIKSKQAIPGGVHAEKDPFFHPANDTNIWISTQDKWDEFFLSTGKEYEQILAQSLPSALAPWVKAANKQKTAEEKIQFILEKMSHDFRYFGDWRRHDGGFIPRPLAEIEKGRYGDCKDLSTLLTAILRQLKIDASVALVRRGQNAWGHEPDYKLPSSYHFNHAIVRAKVGDKTYWLDPTNPVSSLEPFPDIAGRPSFVLSNTGGVVDRLPDIVSEQFQHVLNQEYRFTGDDSVKIKLDADLRRLAPFGIATQLMMSSKSKVLSSTLEFFTDDQELKSYKYTKEPSTGRTLKDMEIGLEYVAGRVTLNAGKSSFFVFPDGVFSGAFYETEDRESDIVLSDQPYQFQGVRRLKDTRLAQDAPEPCKIESAWLTVERKIEADGRDLLVKQNIDLRRPFITQTEFRSPEFKKLQKEAKRCFYRSGLLIDLGKGAR